jgi:hypothetical protein
MADGNQTVSKQQMTMYVDDAIQYRASTLVATRIRSAVWGGALAVALMITTVLPWVSYGGSETSLPTYLTLWQLRQGVAQTSLAGWADLTILLMLITALLTLAAAAEASAGASLSAGIAAVLTVVTQIVLWTRISADTIDTETGIHGAIVVTLCIAVTYLAVGIHRYSAQRYP